MNTWDNYRARIQAAGETKRNAARIREVRGIEKMLKDNLSYQDVVIENKHQSVAVIDTDNLNVKKVCSMPGEDIVHGSYIYWMDNYWLVTDRDANGTLYVRATMTQCNYLLKWISPDGVIHEQWCIVEDGTKLRVLVSVQRNLYVKTSA